MKWLLDMPTFDRDIVIGTAMVGCVAGLLVGVVVLPFAACLVAVLATWGSHLDVGFIFAPIAFLCCPFTTIAGTMIGGAQGIHAARRYRDSQVIIEESAGDNATGGECE